MTTAASETNSRKGNMIRVSLTVSSVLPATWAKSGASRLTSGSVQ